MNILRFFGFDNDEDDYDDNDGYKRSTARKDNPSRPSGNAQGKIIIYNYNSPTLNEDKVRLREEFNKGAMILVDLHKLSQREYDEEGKNFITFMCGVSFARNGTMKFIDPAQYLFTPGPGMYEIWPEGSDVQ
ncbi:MAG: cell division protein SepF [Synergistaceae bacterium]|nr:cell division protein SepF [Synergistaceae bacterium]